MDGGDFCYIQYFVPKNFCAEFVVNSSTFSSYHLGQDELLQFIVTWLDNMMYPPTTGYLATIYFDYVGLSPLPVLASS